MAPASTRPWQGALVPSARQRSAATKLTLPALWSPLVDSAALRAHRAAFPARLGRNSRGGQVNIYRAVAVGFRDLSMNIWV